MNDAFILGLDISSSAIGWCLHNGTVLDRGVIRLDSKSDISERCLSAKNEIEVLLMRYAVDAVAIESPVAKFAKAVIPQARVGAMVLLACAEHSLAWCEVTPTAAKLALADDGAAVKREMLEAAARHFCYRADALEYRETRGEWGAWAVDMLYSEHEADALGVALAAAKMVSVERVTV
jgi:Holliday junction resolvasome RuvABC endonuclease subunit